MPNWVYNTLKVSGDKYQVEAFAERAKQPGLFTIDGEAISDLSFCNFVRPDASIMDEYWGTEPRAQAMSHAERATSNHWYDWNIRNWGCKWDASDVQADITDVQARYDYNTAWSPAIEVFYAMVEQFHDLSFELHYAEEQGWGGEMHGKDGIHWLIKEWDIPETHEETIEHFGYCKCSEMRDDELEWAYDDCPPKKEMSNA